MPAHRRTLPVRHARALTTGGVPALRILATRRARALTAGIVAALVAVAAVLVGVAPAQAAGSPLLTDTFTTNTVASGKYVENGTFIPCLTVPGAASGQVPASCSGTNDTSGSGALRLTSLTTSQSSYFLYNSPLPSRAGLDIRFTQYQYGGSGADGISFFLTDGQYPLTTAGPVGGSLGYNTRAGVPGLAHALIGVGLDAWGNYPVETNAAGCDAQYIESGVVKNVIAIRGPASDVAAANGTTSGYCLLAKRVQLAGTSAQPLATTAAQNPKPSTRGTGVPVRIVVDPTTDPTNYPNPQVRVYWNNAADPIITVPAPQALRDATSFKFGWAASTGGSNDVHEVNALSISTIEPLEPGITVSASAPTTAVAANGTTSSPASVTLGFTGTDGPAVSPIPVTVSIASGAFSGPPTGTRWSCPTPTAGQTSLNCTFTPNTSADVPGATSPALSVPVTSTKSGPVKVTATVNYTNNQVTDATKKTSSANVPFAPVASAVSGSGVAAATNPATVTMTASTSSTATSGATTYTKATNPANGTASISGSTISYTPNAGFSGTDSFTYTASADSQTSAPATVSVTITPTNSAFSVSTSAGTAVDADLAAHSSGTGRSYTTRNASAEIGSVSVTAAGLATVTPASGFSGDATFEYQVKDSADGLSGWKTVTVHVAPITGDVAKTGTLSAAGAATVTTDAPATTASGTKQFALVAGSASPAGVGTFSIDAATGKVTYVAANGTSGVFTARYTVTADGGASTEHTATITVRPYADGVSGSTPANTAVDLPQPAQKGSDLHWAITTAPSHGTATVDAATGVVSYTPNDGYSGPDSLKLTPTSGTGPNAVAGDPVTASVTVTPVAKPVSGTATASAAPAAVDIAIDAIGGTSASPLSVTATTSDARIASVSVVNGAVRITPAAGASGKLVASYTVSDGTSSTSSTATLEVTPVAAAASFSVDNGSGDTFALPSPAGTGPVTYTLVSGTVGTISGSSFVVPTQPAGTSGDRTATYTVTTDDLTSAPATITVHVLPTAQSTSATTLAGQQVTTDLAALSAGTTLHYTVTQPATGTGSVVLNGADATFTPASGFTGTTSYTFTPVDAQGNAAAQPATVTVTVKPVLADLSAEVTLDADGLATVSALPATQPGTPTYELVGTADFGSASIDPNTGKITLQIADGTSGVSTVGYRVTSGGQTSATKHAVFTVRPRATGVSGSTTAGTPTGVAVDLPAPAKQGTDVTFGIQTGPSHGTASVNTSTGVVHYVPADGWSGDDSVVLSVTSGSGASAVSGAAITAAVRTSPVARPVSATATASTSAQTASVAGDATGTGLTLVPGTVTDPRVTGVSVVNGRLAIALAAGASGEITVPYSVTDGTSSSASTTATVKVAPAAAGDEFSVNTGAGATRQLPAAVGSDPQYRLETAFDSASGVTAAISSAGELTVHTTSGQSGTVTAEYVVSSDGVDSAPQTITLHVLPTGTAASQTTSVDHAAADLDLAARSKGTDLSWSYTQPAAGTGSVTVDQATGLATYTPASGWAGTTSWTYTPVDAQGNAAAAASTVTVTVVPTAGDTAASTALDSDGDATVTATPTTTGSGTKHYDITVDPAAGSASFDQSTGVLTYQAANGVSGVFTVKYTITSGGVTSAEHTATITVRPFAKDVTGSTDVNTAVTLPAPVALGSTPFTWTVATAPLHGSVTALNTATGAAVYEPAEGFAGDDSFMLELADGRGASTQVTVTVHVRPAAGDVSATTAASTSPTAVRIPLDGTGAIDHYEITTPLASSLGTAVIDGGDLVITPASGVSGTLVVGYRAVDADGNVSAPATVTLTVRPVAQGGAIIVPSGGTASEALGAPVGTGPLTATVTAPLPAGILAASVDPSTGRITVTTADDFSGTATLTYTATSGSGASAVTSDPATVTVTVDPTLVPAAPATTTATPAGAAPHSVTGSPKATGAGPRTWALGTPATTSGPATPFALDPAIGTATIDPASGQIVVTPAAGFSGPIDVPFTVTDGNGESRSGTFHVDVDPLTSATPGTGASRGLYGASQSYAPPAPVGTAPFTYRISTPPTAAQGTATIDPATGVITFVPAAGFHGVAEISYEVVDASGLVSAPAVVAFTVDPPAPVAGLAHTGVDGILPLGLALTGLLAGLAMVLTVVRRRRLEQAGVPAAQA